MLVQINGMKRMCISVVFSYEKTAAFATVNGFTLSQLYRISGRKYKHIISEVFR